MSIVTAGAASGLLASCGVLLIVAGLPMRRRATLEDRVVPYLADAPRLSRLIAARNARDQAAVPAFLRPFVDGATVRLNRVFGGAAPLRKRLLRAGRSPDVSSFRARQLVWGAVGGAAGAAFGVMQAWRLGATWAPVGLTVCGICLGVVGADLMLSREITRRESRMLAEFPTVAELLALSVSAGEGTAGALERVTKLSSGELAVELRACLVEANAGANLPAALQGLADRTGIPSLARFVDGVVVALERGTPLADVLRAQAQDVREEGRRSVMEIAGRKEIAMMVPVVFLVLPVTVLFAVYPGIALLNIRL